MAYKQDRPSFGTEQEKKRSAPPLTEVTRREAILSTEEQLRLAEVDDSMALAT